VIFVPRRFDTVDKNEIDEDEEDAEQADTPFDEDPQDDDIDLPSPTQRRIPSQHNQRMPSQQMRTKKRELLVVKELPATSMREGVMQDGTPVSFITIEEAIKEILTRLRRIDRPEPRE